MATSWCTELMKKEADENLEDLGVRPPWSEPVCRDDTSLKWAVSVTAEAVLTLGI